MTDPIRPTDDELMQRIRRSMNHYRFDRRAPAAADGRGTRVWQAGRLIVAAAGGAAATIVVLGLLRGITPAPIGAGSPSPTPSPSQVASATPTPPSDQEAAAGCLALEPSEVLEDWVGPGEDATSVAARIGGLPVALRATGPTGSVFVFADDRFVVMCDWSASTSEPEGIARGVREESVDSSVMLLFAFSQADAQPPTPDFDADQIAVGTMRDDVADVTVVLETGARVSAVTGDGLWMALWHEPADAVTLRTSDASGALIDEVPADPTNPSPAPGS